MTPEAAFTTINALAPHINAASPEPARVRVIDGVTYVRGDIAEGIATQHVLLVEALRRVRDEVEYGRDKREADYMADKHATRALVAVGLDPRTPSSGYQCRREANPLVRHYEEKLRQIHEKIEYSDGENHECLVEEILAIVVRATEMDEATP